MIQSILLIIISAFGLVYSFGKEGLFQKVITISLCISISIIQIGTKEALLISLIILVVAALSSFVYGLIIRNLKFIDRLLICINGLTVFIYLIFTIQHWPKFGIEKVLYLSSFLFVLYLIIHKFKLTKEFGFILIWFTLTIRILINTFEY